ncbi:MAG: hypothetical protein IKE25_02275 [Clostridia bacterium]|nr:hypothetical protein [Clostridia bacterium]
MISSASLLSRPPPFAVITRFFKAFPSFAGSGFPSGIQNITPQLKTYLKAAAQKKKNKARRPGKPEVPESGSRAHLLRGYFSGIR